MSTISKTNEFSDLNAFLKFIGAPEDLPNAQRTFLLVKDLLPDLKALHGKAYKYFRKLINQSVAWEAEQPHINTSEMVINSTNYPYYLLNRLPKDAAHSIYRYLIRQTLADLLILIYQRVHSQAEVTASLNNLNTLYEFCRMLLAKDGSPDAVSIQTGLTLLKLNVRFDNTSKSFYAQLFDKLRAFFLAEVQKGESDILSAYPSLKIFIEVAYLFSSFYRTKHVWLSNAKHGFSITEDHFEKPSKALNYSLKKARSSDRTLRQNQHLNHSYHHLSVDDFQRMVQWLIQNPENSKAGQRSFQDVERFLFLLTLLTGWPIHNHEQVFFGAFNSSHLTGQCIVLDDVECTYTQVWLINDDSVTLTLPMPLELQKLVVSVKHSWQTEQAKNDRSDLNNILRCLQRRLNNFGITVAKINESLFNFITQHRGYLLAEQICFSVYTPSTTNRYIAHCEQELADQYVDVLSNKLGLSFSPRPTSMSAIPDLIQANTAKINALSYKVVEEVESSKRVLANHRCIEALFDYHNAFSKYVLLVLLMSTNHRPVRGAFGLKDNIRPELKLAFVSDKVSDVNHLIDERYLSESACAVLKEYSLHLEYMLSQLTLCKGSQKSRLIKPLVRDIASLLGHGSTKSYFFLLSVDGVSVELGASLSDDAHALGLPNNFYRHHWATWCFRSQVSDVVTRAAMGHSAAGQEYLSRYTLVSMADYVKQVSPAVEAYLEPFPLIAECAIKALKKSRGITFPLSADGITGLSSKFKIPEAQELVRAKQREDRRRKISLSVDQIITDAYGEPYIKGRLTKELYDEVEKAIEKLTTSESKKTRETVRFQTKLRLLQTYNVCGGDPNINFGKLVPEAKSVRLNGFDLNLGRNLSLFHSLFKALHNFAYQAAPTHLKLAFIYIYVQIYDGFCFHDVSEFLTALSRWAQEGKPKAIEVGEVGVDLLIWRPCPASRLLINGIADRVPVKKVQIALKQWLGGQILKSLPQILGMGAYRLNSGAEVFRRFERKGVDYPVYDTSLDLLKSTARCHTYVQKQKVQVSPTLKSILSDIRQVFNDRLLSQQEKTKKSMLIWGNYSIQSSNTSIEGAVCGFWQALLNKSIKHSIRDLDTYVSYLHTLAFGLSDYLSLFLAGKINNEEFMKIVQEAESLSKTDYTVFNHLQKYLELTNAIARPIRIYRGSKSIARVFAVPINQVNFDKWKTKLNDIEQVSVEILQETGCRVGELKNITKNHLTSAKTTQALTIEHSKNKPLKNLQSNRTFSLKPLPSWIRFTDKKGSREASKSMADWLGKTDALNHSMLKAVGTTLKSLRHHRATLSYLTLEEEVNALWELANTLGHATPERTLRTYINQSKPYIQPKELTKAPIIAALSDRPYGTVRKAIYRGNKQSCMEG